MKSQKKDYARWKNNILAVDDDPDIVRLIGQALSKHGLKVSAFTDPDTALEGFKVNRKDCAMISSDIRMPRMNGYEFVKKTKEIDKHAKVILMSAFEIQEKEFHYALPDIKVDGFLQKPFSIQQLNDVILKMNS